MAMKQWSPATTVSKQEGFLLKRLVRMKKLFGFLSEVRHELFDDAFQTELEDMYRGTGAGKAPVPPAMMAMAVLTQAYAAHPTLKPSNSPSSTCAGRWSWIAWARASRLSRRALCTTFARA